MRSNSRVLTLTQFSILLAIEVIFCFTPLGSLPAIGHIVATLMMIPVCITAILLGPKMGTLMGFAAGLFSFIVWSFMPPNPATAFFFTPFYTYTLGGEVFAGNFGSILICFLPRTLGGTVTGLINRAMLKQNGKRRVLSYSVSAAVGSFVNTIGVMGGIWLFFGSQYETLAGNVMIALIGDTVLTSGIPESIVAAITSAAVCRPVKVMLERAIPSDAR